MPGMDGTGPQGRGPTGWGRGPCGRGMGYGRGAGYGRGMGYGRGAGYGRGMGFGNRFGWGGWAGRIWGQQYPGADPAADRAALEDQIRMLESDLAAARQQLNAMATGSD